MFFSTGFFFLLTLLSLCCTDSPEPVRIQGEAQGSYYHITYTDAARRNFQREIDSLFNAIDHSLSTYVPSSLLSKFNAADSSSKADRHIKHVFLKSYAIWEQSGGAFDPTVMPLVKYWGFAGEEITPPDSIRKEEIDSIIRLIGMQRVHLFCESDHQPVSDDSGFICNGAYILQKDRPETALDFNAIAQGYTVDVISNFLEGKGIKNYLVEVGGEVFAKGVNPDGKPWRIGIDKPLDENGSGRPLQAVLDISDKGIATSGNYRKYYVKNGVKYAHTINPFTGMPVRHKLLSATVVAPDCMTADGWATAFMVTGTEKARLFLKQHRELSALLIYTDDKGRYRTWASEQLLPQIEQLNENE